MFWLNHVFMCYDFVLNFSACTFSLLFLPSLVMPIEWLIDLNVVLPQFKFICWYCGSRQKLLNNTRPIRLAYQPPDSSIFLNNQPVVLLSQNKPLLAKRTSRLTPLLIASTARLPARPLLAPSVRQPFFMVPDYQRSSASLSIFVYLITAF